MTFEEYLIKNNLKEKYEQLEACVLDTQEALEMQREAHLQYGCNNMSEAELKWHIENGAYCKDKIRQIKKDYKTAIAQ